MTTEEWKHLATRLHEAICLEWPSHRHEVGSRRFPCGKALDVCYDWLGGAGLNAGIAIANDARVGYP